MGYLDPRPNSKTIGLAYASYYTHETASRANHISGPRSGLVRRLRQALRNGELNRSYNYHFEPSISSFGVLRVFAKRKAWEADAFVRHLPAPKPGSDQLLDIGCGNGEFVELAQKALGYRAEGLELDARAVEAARRLGICVHHGSVDQNDLPLQSYAHVTLCHVLEHLHHPVSALSNIRSLLQPGGRVWIEIPNLDAASHRQFGANALLLDSPRHLVMFNRKSLQISLEMAGFTSLAFKPVGGFIEEAYLQSWAIQSGIDPYSVEIADFPAHLKTAARRSADADSSRSLQVESLIVCAYRDNA
ncbi:MAG: class I SAM-dependent methyltransferase [Alphaproteobacteria bacterium]|nr:class I SAM-dependent methyltransferase [Alphaproteobacteria bacterium]